MRLVAVRGDSFILETAPERGRVFTPAPGGGELFPEMPLQAIFNRGYCEPWEGSSKQTEVIENAARQAMKLG